MLTPKKMATWLDRRVAISCGAADMGSIPSQ